ncbi:hypothetical protein GCM10023093_31200 [Nemorincola caseinilytica]|uniref:VWA domain-containing protein n=1 Tax=Nemorincola caseinilytica TaxID=2054315 RepID=A0ABP8NRQ1_9BACT
MQLMYWLLAVTIALGAAFWVYKADRRRAVPLPWLTALLRGLVILSALLLVLVPDVVVTKHTTERPVIFLLQDNSVSAGIALGKDSATYRNNVTSLIQKLGDNYRVVQCGFGDQVREDSLFTYDRQGTDIASALDHAEEHYGTGQTGAVILVTDGRFNMGANPMYRQTAYQGAMYTVALGDSTREKDIRISRTYANRTAALNSSFEIRADIIAELCKGYSENVNLKEGNETIGSTAIPVNGDRFDRSVSFSVKADKAGLHHYTLSLPEAAGEQNTTNNRRDIFVEVTNETKKILIAAAAPHPDVNALKDALASAGTYEVKLCGADDMPASLEAYDALILHGLPSVRHRVANAVTASRKPFWIILSQQTDIAAVNQLKELTHTGITQAPGRDAVLSLSSSFNAFTLPQRIAVIADKMPPLTVYAGNVQAAPGSNVLFTQRTAAGTLPAWVMQQSAVPTAILTGEGIWRWRMYEYKNFDGHDVIDECIRQTVAFLCANNNERQFDVAMPKRVWSDQEPVSLTARLLNANNEQVNTADVQLTLTDSAGRKQQYTMERSGTGYSLNTGIHAGGRYSYMARTSYNGKELTAAGSFVVESIPLELMATGADYGMLYNLAHEHNGTFVTANNVAALYDSIVANNNIKPVILTNSESVPLIDRKWYFIIILALAVAEWLLRKYWLAQ